VRPGDRRLSHGKLRVAALAARGVAALKILALAAIAGYVALVALIWLAQERLQFLPPPPGDSPRAPPAWVLESVDYRARDGTQLRGVLVRPSARRLPLVIYYGGNAEDVIPHAAAAASTYGEHSVLAMNYRGYGSSEGRPGEKDMVADAIELYDWAARRPDVDPTRIALHGRSLGSGVAVQVAGERPVRCVVLTSPFDSAAEVARAIYFWAPVRLLMRHPFDSLSRAPRLRMPALFLVGESDDIIPPTHSDRLAEAWAGPVEQRRFPGFGHNDLELHPGYDESIRAFLARCL